ncbi:hypothetical protein G7B40_001625 [Aetokthonos hydrillicola Thurmond2011]|jgi:hypothetical protein|uniref:Uncharacterized protein n=1 Tax=Aetokthonos hydrillicola Thurmond2011 TaxID=2712845 RepID=A0AAP5M308_9CYAN|nr:hypothetical protein [Aetokthonos hydrillicola]MBO3462978.1 hypothetical protein [Aetokthonos hydrillicola CCALA 1050]MBW4591274.1 hypothetical protein [Aetokthonos hydrillicola CCALA 1050]MDR9893286.1 hypothetical protein [Aetokthonos hydrillicola Thurmond2011]
MENSQSPLKTDFYFEPSSLFGNNSIKNTFGVLVDTLKKIGQIDQSQASNVASNLEQQNQYADYATKDLLNNALQAQSEAGNIAAKNYQQKISTDSQAALTTAQNAAAIQDRHGYSGGSFSGYSDGIYDYEPRIGGIPEHPIVTYVQHLSPQAGMMRLQYQLGEQTANNQFGRDMAIADNNRYNQSLLSAQQGQQQSSLLAQQNASNQKIAALNAGSNIFGSLFGGGQFNGRYW